MPETGTALELAQAASVFLDATPLLDEHWTGIPVVCANMARGLLAAGCDLRFCVGTRVLPQAGVLEALARNSGLFLERELVTGVLRREPLRWPAERIGVGLSASVKRLRRVFDVECSVVHDISTILQPQFHTEDNIAWHAETIMEDLASNDVTLCTSRATLLDLVQYLGADPERLVVAHNGVEWPWWYRVRADGELAAGVEPYLVVLATREPRKNLSLVLEMLCGWPELLERFRIVFVGKAGWLLDASVMPPALAEAVARGRIMQTGFVSDYDKYKLLRGAEATIYPSLYEGFGLPVVEALSVGTPCVASFSASIPEVGGPFCWYFDPCSVAALRTTLEAALGAGHKRDPDWVAACQAWAGRFSWQSATDALLAALTPLVAAKWRARHAAAPPPATPPLAPLVTLPATAPAERPARAARRAARPPRARASRSDSR